MHIDLALTHQLYHKSTSFEKCLLLLRRHHYCYICYCPLVQGAAASSRATETGDLVGLDWELVIVRDFLAFFDISFGIDDNLFLAVDCDNFGVAVGLIEKKVRKRGKTVK
jgi:hypothetical protein